MHNIFLAMHETWVVSTERHRTGTCLSNLTNQCTAGVLYVRHSPESTIFVKEWDSMLAGSPDRVDQIAFNTLIARHTTPLRKSIRNDRLATGPKRQLTVGVLPVPLFMNGHTYFVQELYKV